jgi:hypothetical protein
VRYGFPLVAGTVRGASHHFLGRTPVMPERVRPDSPGSTSLQALGNLSIVVPRYTNILLFVVAPVTATRDRIDRYARHEGA